jgi:hypothetical protein
MKIPPADFQIAPTPEVPAAPVVDRLWTYGDLAVRWSICERQARRAVVSLGLQPVKGLGKNVVRFRPCSVLAAEERGEQGPKRRGLLS